VLDTVLFYLELLSLQLCGPVPEGYQPGPLDQAVTIVITLAVAVALLWFARALFARDSRKIQAIKAQALED
jgi:hypothetical protein